MKKGYSFYKHLHCIIFTLALISAFCFCASAQSYTGIVKGSLYDSSGRLRLGGASISVALTRDTLRPILSLSSSTGTFQIDHLDTGNYALRLSYQGYSPLYFSFRITASAPVKDFGIIKMSREYKTLGEVVVRDEAPVRMKGDTVAYKADAFKTKPNATVEDLLKKLPGVQVDKNGAVKTQGENVQKVYVDGKEFFSNDPNLATKNLTADMIDQVQVFNDMSEGAKFNGIDDGSRTKAINLKLKKEKKSGAFGKVYGGLGPGGHYDAGVTANYFKGASQLSLLAGTNNINKTGYTASSMGPVTGRKGFGAGRTGIIKSSSFGLNYRDTWSKSLDGNGSYFFNRTNNSNLRQSNRQTFLGDSLMLSSRESDYNYLTTEHRLNFRLVFLVDSFNSFIYTPNLSVQNNHMFNSDTLTDYFTRKGTRYLSGNSQTATNSDDRGYRWTNNLLWRRRFSRPGRTLVASLTSTNNQTERLGNTSIKARFYNSAGVLYRQRVSDYRMESYVRSGYQELAISFTEPLGSRKLLEVNYSYQKNKNTSGRSAYTYNPVTRQYDEREDSLSNIFQNINRYVQGGANFRRYNDSYNYQVGVAVQNVSMQGQDKSKNLPGEQQYINVLPAASFNYRFSKNKTLQLMYRTRSNQPAITQLQNVTDVTTYPYIRRGNPDLEQEFVHNVMINYNGFSPQKFQSVFASLLYNNTRRKIVHAIEQRDGEQFITPVNADGAIQVMGNVSLGFPIDKMEGGNLNVTTQADYNRDISVVNGTNHFNHNYTFGQDLNLSYTFREKLDIDFTAGISYNSVHYALVDSLRSTYFSHSYAMGLTYELPEELLLNTFLDYTGYGGAPESLGRNYLMWNISLSKPVLKDKRGTLTLSVHDLLNQNRSVNRSVYNNVVEDIRNQAQQRFALLTFTYNFNKLKGK